MELEDLRTFIEVADAGGLSKAADRLGVTKSVVSRRLARLEEALGIQLLTRTIRGTSATEAGTTFREHAVRICAEMDMARETIFPAGALRGRLRIAAPLTFGSTHIAPVLAELAREHPELQIQTCYSDRYTDLAGEGFDCAIRLGYLPDSGLVARKVTSIHGSLVASPDYLRAHGEPNTPEALLTHEALMQGTESWRLNDGHKTITLHPRGRFKADNGAALTAAALSGLGIAALPDFLIADHVTSGALVRVLTDYPPTIAGLYVVRPSGSHAARKIRVLTDLLIKHLA